MPNPFHLPHQLDREALTVRAVIETPKGHRYKFNYDPESELYELAGVLPAGMAFPLAFGFIPSTIGEDGDPVDILLLADDEEVPIGCLVRARLLGVIEAKQTERGKTVRNDRLIAKLAQSRIYADITDLSCMGVALVDELKRFFVTYNELKGKRFEVTAIGNAERACDLIEGAAR